MTQPSNPKKVERALISVSDKSGIVEFAQSLTELGIEILSTGGTFRLLKENAIAVTEVSDYTGFPEMMDGRVKTLHPKIHGGILGRRGKDDAVMSEHGINKIDLVQETRFDLCTQAFEHTAAYDAAIANYLGAKIENIHSEEETTFPRTFNTQFTKSSSMRYGENPHQNAAFYVDKKFVGSSVSTATQIQGKALSFNNVADTDAALETVKQFSAPACVIVKHANPCGVAQANSIAEAYELAFATP